ncbi:hypothetical protein BK816_00610 [Boudabousia tangfeifanii]|uniref:Uncharacterized protein n=1 Tax=Boudabousia tangfeifanii TaxID=1912795 RepID=A0A1D9MI54_9ACTO|nr:hypothetical protein [Boudabousia tangfeifanii]AOZ71977.1 hypothetical protein BK816_00610 [Boudabousia tangfeifanii]
MSERNFDAAEENVSLPAEGTQTDPQDVYGDTSTALPVVEDANYVGTPSDLSKPLDEDGDSDLFQETPADTADSTQDVNVLAEGAESGASVAAETETETVAAAGTEPVEDELQTTMITRRSLLGGMNSTIPASGPGGEILQPGPSGADVAGPVVSQTPVEAETVPSFAPGSAASTAAPESMDKTAGEEAGFKAGFPSETESLSTGEMLAAAQNEEAGLDEAELFAAASIPATLPSRAGAHAWSLLYAILATVISWFLISDGIAHLSLVENAPSITGEMAIGAWIELGAGLIIAGLIALSARWSTLGQLVSALLLLIVGTPFIAVPLWTANLLSEPLAALRNWNDWGKAIAHHLEWTGYHGLLFSLGVIALFAWFGMHGARKNGAKREVQRQALEEQNENSEKLRAAAAN